MSVDALSATMIRQGNGNSVGQEAVQAPDAALEHELLVVDRDDDVDLGREEHAGSFGPARGTAVGVA